jgi:NADP-dependent 3-hydroxy acid dehydrogenase YdfG
VDRSADAFRFMAQARHIGKIVISLVDQNVQILPSRQETARPGTAQIKPDATYLITGGLGGLGLAVASWLTQQGGRHLMLVGRSGAGNLSPEGQQTLAELQAAGVEVKIAAADISQADQIAAILRQLAESMPPLRGVIHAAGVLDDGVLLQQTPQRIHTVIAPKAIGAWHLHRLTDGEALDFFVMFSSITAPFGSPGQGNYAAANAFLDGLAHHRRGLGLPALSINWGPWGQIGLAAHRQQGGMQGLQGLSAIRTAVGLEIFGRLLEINPPQAQASGLDVGAPRRQAFVALHHIVGRSAKRQQDTNTTIYRAQAARQLAGCRARSSPPRSAGKLPPGASRSGAAPAPHPGGYP